MDNTTIFTLIFGAIISVISGLALHRSTKQSDTVDDHSKKITALESTAVSDSHVRSIVKEEISPLNDAIKKLLDSMHNIEVHIAEEKGFKAGQALRDRRKTDVE